MPLPFVQPSTAARSESSRTGFNLVSLNDNLER